MPKNARTHGTGSVRQRTDGSWEGRYYDLNGKRRSVYAKSKKEAERKLREAFNSMGRGESPIPQRLTLRQYLDDWFSLSVRTGRWRPTTNRLYGTLIREHLNPSLGPIRLVKLSTSDVNRMISVKLESGLSPATVNRIRALLRGALNDAIRQGLLHKNVAALSDTPRERQLSQRWLIRSESKKFIEVALEDRLAPLWILAITAGMREGELLGLQWDKVDFDAGEIVVENQLQRVDGQWTLVPLKTEAAKRNIPLIPLAEDCLRQHYKARSRERLLADTQSYPPNLIFTTASGKPLSARNVVRSFKRLLRECGLPDVRFHDLRHSAASVMIETGSDIKTVQEILGHDDPRTTLKFYGHLTKGHRRAAIDRVAAYYDE